jgi:hypothetical protein
LRALHTLPLPYHACAIRAKRHLLQLVQRTALQVWRLPAGCAGDQGFGGVESATKSKATTQIICKGASSIVGRTRGCRSGLGERDGGGDQGAPQVVTLQRGPFFSSFLPRPARNLPGLESKLVTCVLHPCEGGAGQANDFRLLLREIHWCLTLTFFRPGGFPAGPLGRPSTVRTLLFRRKQKLLGDGCDRCLAHPLSATSPLDHLSLAFLTS